jgi:hypothetical protein
LTVRRVTGSSRDRDHPWNFRIGHFGKVTQSARSADSTLDPDEQFPINIKAGGARRGAAGAIAICSDYLRRARPPYPGALPDREPMVAAMNFDNLVAVLAVAAAVPLILAAVPRVRVPGRCWRSSPGSCLAPRYWTW